MSHWDESYTGDPRPRMRREPIAVGLVVMGLACMVLAGVGAVLYTLWTALQPLIVALGGSV